MPTQAQSDAPQAWDLLTVPGSYTEAKAEADKQLEEASAADNKAKGAMSAARSVESAASVWTADGHGVALFQYKVTRRCSCHLPPPPRPSHCLPSRSLAPLS